MKLHFRASPAEQAQAVFRKLTQRYGQEASPETADVIVTLGGDGETLSALRDSICFNKPVYGINFGHKGHFQNTYCPDVDLIERIAAAETFRLRPLQVTATSVDGTIKSEFAINETQICKLQPPEMIFMRALINGKECVARFGGDGVAIASNLGSTAYSHSSDNVPLPFGDDLLAFTPLAQHKPLNVYRGVLRACDAVRIEILDYTYRPAQAYADKVCLSKNVRFVDVARAKRKHYSLMFDRDNPPHTRVLRVQFPNHVP
jgi:NAD+ kinase